MASLNRVFLIGRITRDVELRYTPKGTVLAEVSLALNRTWQDEGGQKRTEVVFVDVSLWARLAEIAQKYLQKGSPVFIEGRLQWDAWDDKQSGQKRSKLRVVGENLQLFGSRQAAASAAAEPPLPASPGPAPASKQKSTPRQAIQPPRRPFAHAPEPDVDPF